MWPFDNLTIQAALLKISIFWPTKYNAPWLPASMEIVHKTLQLAEVGPEDLIYDLGCGDGRTIITAARDYGAKAVGIELDLLRYLWCQLLVTILGLRGRVRIIYGDFFQHNISAADVVTCYLGQATNETLQTKFEQELRPNARVVSYNFTFPKLNLISQDDQAELFLYDLRASDQQN